MELELASLAARVVQCGFDVRPIEVRGPPHQAVYVVALLKQQFRQVGAVLPGNSGNQRDLFLAGCEMNIDHIEEISSDVHFLG